MFRQITIWTDKPCTGLVKKKNILFWIVSSGTGMLSTVFSDEIIATILLSQNNEMVAMFSWHAKPIVWELNSFLACCNTLYINAC